jgi:hypothetical protein
LAPQVFKELLVQEQPALQDLLVQQVHLAAQQVQQDLLVQQVQLV